MFRLFYVSTARSGMTRQLVDELANAASKKNMSTGITGALGFDGGQFAQILEGQEQDVRDLLDVIEKDERHTGLVVMGEKDAKGRIYEGWGMRNMDGLIFNAFERAMAEA